MRPFLTRQRSFAWGLPTWTGLGALVVGAGLLYLLDPADGRRRRREILGRAGDVARETAESAARAVRDLRNRAAGMLAAARRHLRRDETTGVKLASRVRSRLGRVVSHVHALDVSVEDGRVVLAGPILASEVSAALAEASRVPGVDRVDNEMDAFEEPGRVPALQGGVRPYARPDLPQPQAAGALLARVAGAGLLAMAIALAAATLGGSRLADLVRTSR